jgi:hypothetical protein
MPDSEKASGFLNRARMITIPSLAGLWRRSLLAFPDGRADDTTSVAWLQAGLLYADLRQPAGMPDFSHAAGLNDLTMDDCRWLATQQGFAGQFREVDDCFEWVREMDFCPSGPFKDIGRLAWRGDVLVEEGRDVPYLEHWHRDEPAAAPVASLALTTPGAGARGVLVRAGAAFMYAAGRALPLPAGADLAELVAAAPGLSAARQLLNCEISLGKIEGTAWRITRSTLPFRRGDDLAPRMSGGSLSVAIRDDAGAAHRRDWDFDATDEIYDVMCGAT